MSYNRQVISRRISKLRTRLTALTVRLWARRQSKLSVVRKGRRESKLTYSAVMAVRKAKRARVQVTKPVGKQKNRQAKLTFRRPAIFRKIQSLSGLQGFGVFTKVFRKHRLFKRLQRKIRRLRLANKQLCRKICSTRRK